MRCLHFHAAREDTIKGSNICFEKAVRRWSIDAQSELPKVPWKQWSKSITDAAYFNMDEPSYITAAITRDLDEKAISTGYGSIEKLAECTLGHFLTDATGYHSLIILLTYYSHSRLRAILGRFRDFIQPHLVETHCQQVGNNTL